MRDVNYDDNEISEVTSLKPTTTTNYVDEEGRVITFLYSHMSDYTSKRYQHIISSGMTVVTALMDIGRGEWFEYRRPLDKYHSYMENVLSLKVPFPRFDSMNLFSER